MLFQGYKAQRNPEVLIRMRARERQATSIVYLNRLPAPFRVQSLLLLVRTATPTPCLCAPFVVAPFPWPSWMDIARSICQLSLSDTRKSHADSWSHPLFWRAREWRSAYPPAWGVWLVALLCYLVHEDAASTSRGDAQLSPVCYFFLVFTDIDSFAPLPLDARR